MQKGDFSEERDRSTFGSIYEIGFPMREVGLQFSLPAQPADAWKDRSARLNLILSSLPMLAKRFPTGIRSAILFERKAASRTTQHS